MTFRMRLLAIACLPAFVFIAGEVSVSRAIAQDPGPASPPKDDALDKLFDDLDKEKKNEPAPKGSETKPTPKPDDNNPKPKPKADEPKPKAPVEVKDSDKDVDSLLEKLGETEDKPTPDDPRQGGGSPPPSDDPPKDDAGGSKPKEGEKEKSKSASLTGKSKDLDEHLEDLTGRKRKKKSDDDNGGGALGDVVKEMRDVEQRLGKTDTGESTRKKQQTIVKNLETLIEQIKQSGQAPGKKQLKISMKPGDKPGEPKSETPGNTGGNAPFAKPEKPTNQKSLANSKDAWGHLPPELRQEMENVFKEDPLPAYEELIRRYYLSVSKKSLNRGSH